MRCNARLWSHTIPKLTATTYQYKFFFIPSKFNCEKIAYQSFARAKKLHLCFAADGRWPLQLHKCIIVKIFDAQHFPIRFLIASHSSPHSYSDSYVYRRGRTTFSFNFFLKFFLPSILPFFLQTG